MKLAIIGVGNMGQALVLGILKNRAHLPEEILLYDYDENKAMDLAKSTGCIFCREMGDAVDSADAVLLAVKPQVMVSVIDLLNPFIREGTIIISIAAGITIKLLKDTFVSKNLHFVRVMPNTPALIGYGASALCFSDTSKEDEEYCIKLFESCGIAIRVDESKMDAVTGLSGSGPAYGMIFIEAMASAGVALGLNWDEALMLSAMTLKGAAAMVLETGIHPTELKNRVCSPGGTTIEGVKALDTGEFRETTMEAVFAAAKKSKELSCK